MRVSEYYTLSKIERDCIYFVLHKHNFLSSDMLQKNAHSLIENKKYENLLKISFDERASNFSVLYHVKYYTSLSDYLNENDFSMEDFLTLFKAIVSAVEKLDVTIFDINKLMLFSEQYIFLSKHLTQIEFMYIPFNSVSYNMPLQQDLYTLVISLRRFINNSDDSILRKIKHILQNPNFELQQLKDYLNSSTVLEKNIEVQMVSNKMKNYIENLKSKWKKKSTVIQVQPVQHPIKNINEQISVFQNMNEDATSVLENDDATVLLDDNGNEVVEVKKQLLVQISTENQQKKLIKEYPFTVGRNEDIVHFVLPYSGISRAHFQIVQLSEVSFGIKDLQSKNGTKLNGQKLESSKVYPIKTGDSVQVAKHLLHIQVGEYEV